MAGCGVLEANEGARLLHTTLDNAGAITKPSFIKSGGTGYAAGTYAPSPCGGALVIDEASDCAKYGADQNINPKVGTVDFFVRPSFEKDDGKAHRLFALTNTYMQLTKTAAPENALVFGIAGTPVVSVGTAALTFVKDTWTRVTLTWAENSGQVTGTLYLDGVQVAQKSAGFPAQSPPNPMYLYVGNLQCNSADHGMAQFDDFKIYDKVLPPN